MIQVHIRDKTIVVDAVKRLVIGGQNGADTIRFVAQKVYRDEVDLSGWTWYLQFRNRNGEGESILLTKTVADNLLYLDWTPGTTATQVSGRMEIQLYATDGDAKWVTALAVIYVDENLNPDEIVPTTPTAWEQYLEILEAARDAAAESEDSAELSAAAASESKTAASTSATSASASASAAAASAAAALASKTAAATSETNALVSKNTAASKATEASDAAAAAKGYRDEAMALAGVGNHVTNPMPHQFQLGSTWYKYGFKATSDGTVQFIYEEVV